MDYKDFIDKKTAFADFVKLRKEVLNSAEDGDFADAFIDLCTKAMSGDAVAQDVVAYFFNKGYPDVLAPNYEYYMSWQILAGANGNMFAIEKMKFFLDPALSAIVDDEQVLQAALYSRTITKENALDVISNLICEGIVDELKINPKKLIHVSNAKVPYSAELNRKFVSARDKCLQSVAQYLVS